MAKKEKKEEHVIIKIYLVILFLCGIGIWFAAQSVTKSKVSIDIEIDKRVVDVLYANGIKEDDIISKYTRERKTRFVDWVEFYKKIQLRGDKKHETFETGFRGIARALKIGLSKTENSDGSITYKLYDSDRNYSNITFIESKKPSRLKGDK